MVSKESQRHVESVEKALEILKLFETSSKLKLKDISLKTSLNKSRIIRLCGTMMSMGFLRFSPDDMTYSLGIRIHKLGEQYKKNNPLYDISKPIIEELALKTKETCSIFIIDGTKRLCLARVEGDQPIRFSIAEGSRHELYRGASSKVLLAYSTDVFRNKVLKRHKEIRSIEEYVEELNCVRKQSYAYSESESEIAQGLSALSCPIFDFDGMISAAMSIAGPTSRFTNENKKKYLKLLRHSAQHCSNLLSYVPK